MLSYCYTLSADPDSFYQMVIKEIFTSLQGEGANFGRLATFVRLAGCNLDCSFCDTDFKKGEKYTLPELDEVLDKEDADFLIWTGGEPTLQLTEEIVEHYHHRGYLQAIETNGTRRPPIGPDYIACSPKVPLDQLWQNFRDIHVGEFRYPVAPDLEIPSIDDLPPADHYFLSPIFDGSAGSGKELFSQENLALCLRLIHRDPRWRLSVQMHKFVHIP